MVLGVLSSVGGSVRSRTQFSTKPLMLLQCQLHVLLRGLFYSDVCAQFKVWANSFIHSFIHSLGKISKIKTFRFYIGRDELLIYQQ